MSSFKALWALAGMLSVGLAGGVAEAQDSGRTPRFCEVVAQHFDAWDSDRNGRISAEEIDRACVNPGIHGSEAAAVAALKRIVRSEKFELPPLTKDFLAKPAGHSSRRATPPRDTDRDDSTEKAHNTDQVPVPTGVDFSAADFQSRYAQCLSRIEKTDRALFKDRSELTLDHCHQGPLGDCFFVSVVGGMVRHDAGSIRNMIAPLGENGGYDVRFGNGRAIHVAPLTDAEIAISSTTIDRNGQVGGEGLWLAVLEKAFGTLRISDSPSRYAMESATDALAKGGSTGSSIQLLTGHRTDRITIKRQLRDWNPDETDRNGRKIASPAAPTEPAGALDSLERRVRSAIEKTLSAGHLVATGTGDEKVPPGMSSKHAYAVLALNSNTDMVTVWNPHGNSFRPRGQTGIANGYPTKSGVFEISMRDFVRVFNGLTYETDRPLSGHASRS